ncbi:Phosphoribosyl transferase domain containing protein [Novymonas esmeraldas]|uniref:adenine phosphoribosyltransferase n=1 Tax=Novymonas esmeraldas TaxID=1808958 RepID=A0AAW0F5W7_9TRYP
MPRGDGLVEVAPHHYMLDPAHPLSKALVEAAQFTTSVSAPQTKIPRLYDVTSITESPALFKGVLHFLADRYRAMGAQGPTHVLAIETRGCILGAPLALLLGLPFVPMRRDDITENAFVRDGGDAPPAQPIAVRHNSISATSRVVIVDDFISSGRTMDAAMDCAAVAGSTIVEAVAVCDMSASGGVEHIRKEKHFRQISVVTLFRLRNNLDVLSYKRIIKSRM